MSSSAGPATAEATASTPAPATTSSEPPAAASSSAPAATTSSTTQPPNVPPPVQDEDVEADQYDGGDSTYDSEVASYTTSLASSVTEYKYEQGRRYHAYKEGTYLYPNDENEKDRLDITHQMILVSMHGKLHYAPIKDPKRVLDIGTGTGIWAMEMGDKFPQADILGNDLSPIQPRWVPPNVRFEVDDVEADWTYSRKFDFIFCRAMGMGIRDWPRLVKQVFEFTEPGGYAEFVDFDVEWMSPDNTISKDSVTLKANQELRRMAEQLGVEHSPGPKLENWVKDAGFTEIVSQTNPLPVGTWTADKQLKKVGAWNWLQMNEGLEGFMYAIFTRHLGYSKEEVDVMAARMRTELKNPKQHSMIHLHIVYGKKPEEKSKAADDE